MMICRGCGAVRVDPKTMRHERVPIPLESTSLGIDWVLPHYSFKVDGKHPVDLIVDFVLCGRCEKKLEGSE